MKDLVACHMYVVRGENLPNKVLTFFYGLLRRHSHRYRTGQQILFRAYPSLGCNLDASFASVKAGPILSNCSRAKARLYSAFASAPSNSKARKQRNNLIYRNITLVTISFCSLIVLNFKTCHRSISVEYAFQFLFWL